MYKGKNEGERMVPFEEARKYIASVSRRVALLHLCYAKAIINELGTERGKRLILKAIKDFGRKIGEKTREEVLSKDLEPVPENFEIGESYVLPKFGMHDKIEVVEIEGEKRFRVYGCILAKVWKEYGEESLGRYYCYMDIAKYMGFNPDYKLIHTKCVLDGDEYCELVVRRTTEKERKDFFAEGKDWTYLDKE